MLRHLFVLILIFAALFLAVNYFQPKPLMEHSYAQGGPTSTPTDTPTGPAGSVPAFSGWGALLLVVTMGMGAVHFLRKHTAE